MKIEELKKIYNEGEYYLLGTKDYPQDFKKAFDLFKIASDEGYFLATYNIACMYYFGHGVKKDLNEALNYYILGSNQGDKEASFHAGEVALELNKNDIAEKYLRLACERKSLGGMLSYALFIIDKNKDEALKIIIESSNLGNGFASLLLGDFYMEGKYLDKNEKNAFNYYLKAAELRVNAAEEKVARCYKEGIGTKIDLKKAEYYLKMSKIPYED